MAKPPNNAHTALLIIIIVWLVVILLGKLGYDALNWFLKLKV